MIRILETIYPNQKNFEKLNSKIIVLTSYFTTKHDPNRNTTQKSNDFKYIEKWYESIMEFELHSIVFHDSLSEQFVEKYQNKNVRFIKCTLGEYSLNDERFFVYLEFLEKINNFDFILCTDINDVEVNKNPMEIIKKFPDKIFVGRGDRKSWGSSPWNIDKIKQFGNDTGTKLPSGIFSYPVFNAGLIAGKASLVSELFKKMVLEFEKTSNDKNHNMAVLNYVLFRDYFPQNRLMDQFISFSVAEKYYRLKYSLVRKLFEGEEKWYNIVDKYDGIVNSDLVYSGFPFNSMFKKYESKGQSNAYLIHK